MNLDFTQHCLPLAAAYVLALPIGWNREREERSAGIRTFPLVALATWGLIQATERLTKDDAEAMARIIEGLITGMGFIGGGAILRLKDSVRGTAAAASLGSRGQLASPRVFNPSMSQLCSAPRPCSPCGYSSR